MQSKNSWVLHHLFLAYKIGPATIYKILSKLLLTRYPDLYHVEWTDIVEKINELDLSILYSFSIYDLVKMFGLTESCAQQVVKCLSDPKILERELFLAEKNDIKIVNIFDTDYPGLLQHIHSPPLILYFSGALIKQDTKCFAIIGARAADDYSLYVIETVVPTLVANGWSIVSGGANGADTMAHRVTLDVGGKTVVVLGSGSLSPYPKSNIELFKIIVNNGGTIISPFPIQKSPDKSTFPLRNRVISGLSRGCLVTQAAVRSGALITANFALEQGRLVFAAPGRISDRLSAGCNELIKQGAKLVCNASDILEEFGEELPRGVFKPAVNIEQQFTSSKNECDICEDVVLSSLDGISSIDELTIKTGLDFVELQNRLFNLQLEGKVRQNFAGVWEKIGG